MRLGAAARRQDTDLNDAAILRLASMENASTSIRVISSFSKCPPRPRPRQNGYSRITTIARWPSRRTMSDALLVFGGPRARRALRVHP
jgi:hypothetical protein